MNIKELAAQAQRECSSAETTAHHGGGFGRPFWNAEATQFMYVPAFQFPHIPGCSSYIYRYTATDCMGNKHVFEADNSTALLTPIWGELPEGQVSLSVDSFTKDGSFNSHIGERTFHKLAPFGEGLPKAVCSYRESAMKAYEYAMKQDFIQHFLTEGTPDPYYDLFLYPSKMIASIINAMLSYAKLCPDKAGEAIKVAVNAADYLIGISFPEGSPLAFLPPTYYFDFCPDPETYWSVRNNLENARKREGTVMMIYPPLVGLSYLALEKATGEERFFEAAVRIADYYRKTVEPNGSWKLVRYIESGEPVYENYITPIANVCRFMTAMNERTGEDIWKQLADGGVAYVEREMLSGYNWEAQFEDSPVSSNYFNLAHFAADALIQHYAKYYADDPAHMETAEELMRFVEDQFVIWKKPAPWSVDGFDTSLWHTPAGLEQYNWHVPIDSSTATILKTFLSLYKAGRGELYLAKAEALADQLTVVQHPDGQIPTHWMNCDFDDKNFWINCMFHSAGVLVEMAEIQEGVQ